nr:MAG TPA: beta-clamp protein [Bacteriophage sp.]
MSDKEMNLAILNKLYEIAHKVFMEGCKVPDGSYNATDLAKLKECAFKSDYLKTESKNVYDHKGKQFIDKDCFVYPMATVSVLSFICSFCVVKIFALVARFEKLAGIPTKDRQLFVAANNVGNVLRTFDVEINKDLGKLAKFAAKDELRPIMNNICLDISRHRAVASDGHTLQVRQFAVCDGSAWDERYGAFYPLIPANEWKKMCALSGKGAKLVCKLVENNENERYWMCECCGITSKYAQNRYPNYISVIPNVDKSKCLQLDKKTWNAAKKWVKSTKMTIDALTIIHKEGSDSVQFVLQDNDFGTKNVAEFPCIGTPNEYYYVCVKASTLVKIVDEFNLYLPESADRALEYISEKVITLQMPLLANDMEYYYLAHNNKSDAFDVAEFPTKEQIALLDDSANNRTQSVIPAKVDNVTTEEKECDTEEENKQTEQTNTPAKVVSLDKSSNKFSFDAVGVNVGDELTFIDGTKVIAAEDNKVSFCGELFTLSGFCKEFMPDDKRTKSNTYRGCAFFFKDGIKLEKLFKEHQKKSLVSSKEEIAAVPNDTLDNAPSEPIAAEECTERTITPSAKENVSERKETASTAKVVAISIGVHSCLYIPPNNVRLDIAANKPFSTAVGDCLCGVGKVVHTLPLPPPRSKRMSELITYTNFYNTS